MDIKETIKRLEKKLEFCEAALEVIASTKESSSCIAKECLNNINKIKLSKSKSYKVYVVYSKEWFEDEASVDKVFSSEEDADTYVRRIEKIDPKTVIYAEEYTLK